ncbi:helix-turn-helix domain-containing protein [Streptococcus dysgalactiae subsp. equisimilis]|uniref:helix-turn-helix domain-containing protein n=1 Tax=Streptococcus dysgalactiae TaxID=1334 RepID=UPI000DBE2533|nr:helix-turn-helix domain-containing protein [Streptococcus dysgalactiae]MBM6541366.1 helix-turn-helix domain-containing protein [Streptococcus dysgalactiae subsp. equisimilis]
MSYHHFTIDERESILIYRTKGMTFSQIARLLHQHPSSISREWQRHSKLLFFQILRLKKP